MPIRGHDLIAWGFQPGPVFKDALALAAKLEAQGQDIEAIKAEVLELKPALPVILKRRAKGSYALAIEATNAEEEANVAAVRAHMDELMKTPVLEQGVVMPDACPAGNAPGTIPVGGAVVSRAIHPGLHSADICCSMHVSLYDVGLSTGAFMDALQASTRFGPGGRRPETQVADPITDEIETTRNPFLEGLEGRAKAQLADQGDGNHFAYLGAMTVTPTLVARLAGVGQHALCQALQGRQQVVALVTHHGSRDLGAQVYKRGSKAATEHTKRVSPETRPHQAWLDPDSEEGAAYWDALQYVARWTKRNHELIHERTAERLGITQLTAFGNEHNFVWQRGDRFYHGKGATPAWTDEAGHPLLGVIPLNMAEPILVTLGTNNDTYASFAPHGAGRNKSRTQLMRELGLSDLTTEDIVARGHELLAQQTEGLDVRFVSGRPDISETPIAYKSAATVRAQIDHFGLAEVIAEITPLGCLMAGDYDKPWLRKRAKSGSHGGSAST
jgi:hypothetical protein